LKLGPLYGDCGELSKGDWEIRPYKEGFLCIYGKEYVEQPAIVSSLKDHMQWGKDASGVYSVGDLNALTVEKGEKGRQAFSMAAEFRQDQKLTRIARLIHERNRSSDEDNQIRVLAIAGPTSSGKTTFAHKLSMYLKNYGYPSRELSVDHYYLNLEDQPKFKVRGERTDVDYDHIESMDIPMVSDHIARLINGEEVCTPQYDFKSGNRVPPGHAMQLPPKGILLIEGIHALNPEYTASLDNKKVFKIYISPLVCLQVDDFNCLKTTYHRLLRRMTRDYKFRGYSAEHTLSKWSHVRRGEHMHIFKHQNNADFVMNSAMEHEVAVLKSETEPLLRCVPPTSETFGFAQEVLSWLENVSSWPEREISYMSIFREFIGNGAYDKH
jgi:uridine kinase